MVTKAELIGSVLKKRRERVGADTQLVLMPFFRHKKKVSQKCLCAYHATISPIHKHRFTHRIEHHPLGLVYRYGEMLSGAIQH